MEQLFLAIADALVPWIEERYGTLAATCVALAFVIATLALMVTAAAWMIR